MTPVRVVIVDDHAMVRTGLRLVIESHGMTVVAEAPTGEAAIRVLDGCGDDPADVVVMDLVMDGMGGLAATREIRERWPRVAVLVLTGSHDDELPRDAFEAGASGFVLKESEQSELAQAIETVARGGLYLHPSLGARIVIAEAGSRSRAHAPAESLTPRELDVLRLVARGYANREISVELGISVRTVESHRTNIIRKTGLRTRAEIVRFATDSGLLT